MPGYTRGLSFHGPNAFVGLSRIRDVAFSYELADGWYGIAIAVIPEPAGLILLATATLALCRRRRGGSRRIVHNSPG